MIAPIMSRLRRRTFVLLTGVIIFSTLFLLSRRVGISNVGGLTTTPFTNGGSSTSGGGSSSSAASSGGSSSGDNSNNNKETEDDDRKATLIENDEMQKALAPMVYGTSSRPAMKAMQQETLGDMPTEYLLADGSTSSAAEDDEEHTPKGKRLIFIGDVHGQLSAFKDLLKKLDFDKSNGDHLVMLGDMVNKGPDSAGVVQLAMDLDASAVRGNNEDRIILAQAAIKAAAASSAAAAAVAANSTSTSTSSEEKRSESSSEGSRLARRDDGPFIMDNLEQEPFSHGDEEDIATVNSLTHLQMTWLASLPVILRIGHISGATSKPWNAANVVAVHAGLVPGLALDAQDPWAAMNMRSFQYPGEQVRRKQVRKALEKAAKDSNGGKEVKISDSQVDKQVERLRKQRVRESGGEDSDREVIVPMEKHDGDPWADIWDERIKNLAPEERTVVIYGHDAKAGLRVGSDSEPGETYAFGLDSGCVYGRQLSALVLERGSEGVSHKIVQVDCEKVEIKETE